MDIVVNRWVNYCKQVRFYFNLPVFMLFCRLYRSHRATIVNVVVRHSVVSLAQVTLHSHPVQDRIEVACPVVTIHAGVEYILLVAVSGQGEENRVAVIGSELDAENIVNGYLLVLESEQLFKLGSSGQSPAVA